MQPLRLLRALPLPRLWRYISSTLASLKSAMGSLEFSNPLSVHTHKFFRALEAAGYDVEQLGVFHWAVVTAGTWAEFVLPALIIVGFFARLASIGMIGFIIVQSLTDLFGHGAWEDPAVLGAWFDRMPDGVILDQRMFWVLTLAIIVFKGAGWLSLDRFLTRSDA
jgi:putative oxidoreductase